MGKAAHGPKDRNNTLNLSSEQLGTLLDELDEMSEGASPRRQHSRLEFRKHAIEVEVYQPSGGSVNFCVACRNLSRGGMSAVHSSYMHIGTKCRIKMHHKVEGEQWIRAEVVQCRHVTGRVHDVGFRFAKEIDVNDYLKLDPLGNNFSLERVEADKLEGRILLVAGNEIDRKLIEVFLSETSLRMVHVPTYDEILGQFTDPFDVVLCDFDMDAYAATQGVRGMRAAGYAVPVIAIAGDASDAARAAIRSSGASALVTKPIERVSLLRAIAEFVLVGRRADADDATSQSKVNADPSLKALADLFIQDLQRFADEIAAAVKAGDEKNLRYICARIRGTGPLLGHGNVADAAAKVLGALDGAQGSIESAQESINALMSLCKLARPAA
jgi:CheY-like chemotaxis protein